MQPHTPDHRPTRRRDPFARWVGRILWVGSAVAVVTVIGCRQIGKITKTDDRGELLEAELRTREREVLELRAENQQLKQLTDIYQRQGYPGGAVVVGGPVLGPAETMSGHAPTAAPVVRELTLGTGTGGRDDDGLPGDETLQVVIVPKDDEGTAVKAAGRATVSAMDITREGLKLPIGKWEVTGEQLKKTWRTGLLGGGYFVPLRWDQPPVGERVRVTVRFTTADGRAYEADKDVLAKPLPGIAPRSVPVPLAVPAESPFESVVPPGYPSDSTLLPVPRVIADSPAQMRPAVPK